MKHRKLSRLAGNACLALLAGALALTTGAAPSHAEQFILVDEVITMTKAQADRTQSHVFVRNISMRPGVPRDWTAPVNYRNGVVRVRLEVIEKPSDEVNQWSLCYIPNRGQGNGYGCAGSGQYREKGVYDTRQESMTSWWENGSIIWTQGIKEMHLVVKDADGASGHLHRRPDPEKFFPFKVRITMVQVSQGAQYDPSIIPNAGGADGGAPADSGTSAADGGSETADAGGAGGQGGATGPGGAGGSAGGGGAGSGGAVGTGAGGSSSAGGSGGKGTGGTGGSSARTGGSRGADPGDGEPDPDPGARGGVKGGCAVAARGARPSVALGALVLGCAALAARGRRRRGRTTS